MPLALCTSVQCCMIVFLIKRPTLAIHTYLHSWWFVKLCVSLFIHQTALGIMTMPYHVTPFIVLHHKPDPYAADVV